MWKLTGTRYHWLHEGLVTRQGSYAIQVRIPTPMGNHYLEVVVRDAGVNDSVRPKR